MVVAASPGLLRAARDKLIARDRSNGEVNWNCLLHFFENNRVVA